MSQEPTIGDLSVPVKILPDGRHVEVIPLTFGRARIIVHRGSLFLDDAW